ncbi:MAG TPA: phosphodiester glycosidase family protein, partial [Myxococcota bacterium]|nr:phosphodiester glycosidase family protein [Myxococcota bacterium]
MAALNQAPRIFHFTRGLQTPRWLQNYSYVIAASLFLLLASTRKVIFNTNGLALAELATVLGGLGCVDAMGLDGGTSTGLFVHTSTRMESVPNLKPVPVIIGLRPD